MKHDSMICFACTKNIEVVDRIGRRETCPSCHADLHCCRNCDFYDAQAYNECRETSAERVLEKDRSNFCEYFTPPKSELSKKNQDPSVSAKKRLEELFLKK